MFVIDFICTNVSLEKQYDRASNPVGLSTRLKQEIAIETKTISGLDLLNYSLKKTAKALEFGKTNSISKGKANCVGYAQLCSSIFNYSCNINNIARCEAFPVIGTIKFNEIDLCKILKNLAPDNWKKFVMNHDFVEFHVDGKVIYADPTAKDLLNKSFITFI